MVVGGDQTIMLCRGGGGGGGGNIASATISDLASSLSFVSEMKEKCLKGVTLEIVLELNTVSNSSTGCVRSDVDGWSLAKTSHNHVGSGGNIASSTICDLASSLSFVNEIKEKCFISGQPSPELSVC